MYRKVCQLGFCVTLALMSAMSLAFTSLAEVNFPTSLKSKQMVTLDYSRYKAESGQAWKSLIAEDHKFRLGLVRSTPNLHGAGQDRDYIPLSGSSSTKNLASYGSNMKIRMLPSSDVTNLNPDGKYLVTGGSPSVSEWLADMGRDGIQYKVSGVDIKSNLDFIFGSSEFLATSIAIDLLLVSLCLFWLTVRARRRFLRTLGGVDARRAMVADTVQFWSGAVIPTIVSFVAMGIYAWLAHGHIFVSRSLYYLCCITVPLLALGALLSAAISWLALPRAKDFAQRRPPLATISRASAATFALAVAAVALQVGPTWRSATEQQKILEQQENWRILSTFGQLNVDASVSEKEFSSLALRLDNVATKADSRRQLALSYAWEPGDIKQAGVRWADSKTLALVNRAWLRKFPVGSSALGEKRALTSDEAAYLEPNLELWRRHKGDLRDLSVYDYRPVGDNLPLLHAGSLSFIFPKTVSLVVVDSVSREFNANFVASLFSTGNILIDGLPGVRSDLAAERVPTRLVRVTLAAEEGVRVAQEARLAVALRVSALIAMVAALLVSSSVSALVQSIELARRNFIRISAGFSPCRVAVENAMLRLSMAMFATVAIGALRGQILGLTVAAFLTVGLFVGGTATWATGWVFRKSVVREI